jgi:purine-binding chemotaxis protein CheW
MGAEQTSQYLTFRLGEEVFALGIGQVREVLDFTQVTRVPRMPEFMRGVINLRGAVVPVVDLRLRFGLGATERTVNTCVIIAEVEVQGESALLGALADSVQEVIDLEPGQIEPPPRLGASVRAEFIRGMGKREEGFVIILDADRVFSGDELALVQGAGGDAPRAE